MAKQVKAIIKLQIEAGKANPAPPIGPALGQHGVGIMDFVREFNARTADQAGEVLPTVVTVYEDRSFSFVVKSPPAATLLKRAAGVTSGSPVPHKQKVAKVTWEQCREIARKKMADLNTTDVEAAAHSIAGTARSMGFIVEGHPAGRDDAFVVTPLTEAAKPKVVTPLAETAKAKKEPEPKPAGGPQPRAR